MRLIIYEGEMAEWSNAAVSKTVVRQSADRGFEPPSLRNDKDSHSPTGGRDFCFKGGRTKLVLLRPDLKQKPNERSELGVFVVAGYFHWGSPKVTPLSPQGLEEVERG